MNKELKIKKQFIGKNQNATIDFDVKKAFPNDTEIAGILHIKKEEVAEEEVRRFNPKTEIQISDAKLMNLNAN